ncbi:peptidase S15 [Mycolicibacterium aurum]|uniref:Peptidase S15 n=1 Tax=Mycolicibacterium aurum TaxID=1791 RepID=A0A3S4RTV2_MYCAU|nr:peptidase S15 [Mycolicibacterium aurum]
MGRHSRSYLAAQPELPVTTPLGRGASAHVGRVGLLAVALGIGAAIAGGTATASADTSSSNASADSAAQSSTAAEAADGHTRDTASADDDPGSAPSSALSGVRATGAAADDAPVDDAEVDDAELDDDEVAEVSSDTPVKKRSSQVRVRDDAPSPASTTTPAASTVDSAVPSPADQVATEYGDIGKWMLQPDGEIADYGTLPYEGRIVLEPINVIIVDPTSKSALGATWKLSAAMRRAGFPPRIGHSTGFRALIDEQRYRQQPRGLLLGYSDDFFLVDNNHGRLFGPDPVETAAGFVWSGAFSTEELVFFGGLPRHAYVSSNTARAALAAQLVASGQARVEDMVSLDNSYNTDTTTTGDHDGYAVVVVLNDVGWFTAATAAATGGLDNRTCVSAGRASTPSAPSCEAITITAIRGPG